MQDGRLYEVEWRKRMLDPEGTIVAFGEYPQHLKNDVEITTT